MDLRHPTVIEGSPHPKPMAINGPSHGVLWCYGYSPIDILSWLMLYAELS